MKMIGVVCDVCCTDLLDSGNKCIHCGRPYNEFQLKMVKEHHAAKMRMVEKAKRTNPSKDEMLQDIRILAETTTKLAETNERLGGDAPSELIERGFQTI